MWEKVIFQNLSYSNFKGLNWSKVGYLFGQNIH